MITQFPQSDYLYDVARGKVSGARPYGAYGEKVSTGADSGVLWSNGAYAFPASSGVQMSVVSTSANDASSGSGIRTLQIHYLDANLAEQSETVTLNGVTPVNTVATNIRFIQYIHMLTYGSGKCAAGNISISNGGTTYGYVSTGSTRCASSVRMVPAGKRMVVTSFYGGASSGSAAAKVIVHISTPSFEGHSYITDNIFIPIGMATYQDNSNGLTIQCPLTFTEGQVFGMTFTTDKAATITGSWFGWMENV